MLKLLSSGGLDSSDCAERVKLCSRVDVREGRFIMFMHDDVSTGVDQQFGYRGHLIKCIYKPGLWRGARAPTVGYSSILNVVLWQTWWVCVCWGGGGGRYTSCGFA